MARELIILPRFKRDYRRARQHPEFDKETLEHIFDLLIAGEPLPIAFNEHRIHPQENLIPRQIRLLAAAMKEVLSDE